MRKEAWATSSLSDYKIYHLTPFFALLWLTRTVTSFLTMKEIFYSVRVLGALALIAGGALSSCSVVPVGELQQIDGLYYTENSLAPYAGVARSFYENGQKESEYHFREGLQHGVQGDWYENGQKERQLNYEKGKRQGVQRTWYENGQQEMELTYEEGKKEGQLLQWNKDGRPEPEVKFVDGVAE